MLSLCNEDGMAPSADASRDQNIPKLIEINASSIWKILRPKNLSWVQTKIAKRSGKGNPPAL